MQVQEVEILPPLAPEGERSEPAGGRGGVAMGRPDAEVSSRAKRRQFSAEYKARTSQSRVAKIESGDPSVSLDRLTRSMLALGASKKDIARAMER